MSYTIGMRNKKTLVADDKCSCGNVAQISRTIDGVRVHDCLECMGKKK